MIHGIFKTLGILIAVIYPLAAQQERVIAVDLAYQAPGKGPMPNFSPYGTQVKLTDLPADAPLPEGAARPAKTGTVPVGPNQGSWIKILVTSDAAHPQDLCRLYADLNRNGVFGDDGPAFTANPAQNAKTKAWWSSFNKVELPIPYDNGAVEPYMVNFWAVREAGFSAQRTDGRFSPRRKQTPRAACFPRAKRGRPTASCFWANSFLNSAASARMAGR